MVSGFVMAQQDSKMAFYFYRHSMQLYNPAATGLENHTTLNTNFRNQWIGIEGAPRVQAFTLSVPGREKRLGYGLTALIDQTFVERQTRVFATFAYRLPLGNSNSLYLGIQGGGNHINLNFNNANIAHDDDSKVANVTRFYPNIGVGAYLKMQHFYLSFAAPLLFSHKGKKIADAITPAPADDLHLYCSAGVSLPAFAKDWRYIAATLVRWAPHAPLTLQTNIGMAYKRSELTLAYHHNSSLGATFFLDTGSRMSVGYAYQFTTPGRLPKWQASSHELLFRIRFIDKKSDQKSDQKSDETETEAIQTQAPGSANNPSINKD